MSKDVIKKLLQDATQYSDEAEVVIAGQKVSLGDLRALDADERKTVNDAIAKANKLRDDAIAAAGRAQEVYDQSQKVIKDAEERAKAAGAGGGGGNDPWATEVWLKPVDERFKKQDAALEEVKTILKQVSGIVGNGLNAFAESRWDDQYNGLRWGKAPKKSREEMIEYAKTNKLLDRNNLPSISAAFDHMTAPDRQKERDEQLREEGRQRGIAESLASRFPAPNVPGPGISAPPPKAPASGDILGNLYEQSVADPELRGLVEQLGALNLV